MPEVRNSDAVLSGMTQEDFSDKVTFDPRPIWSEGQVKGMSRGKASQGRDQQSSEMGVDLTCWRNRKSVGLVSAEQAKVRRVEDEVREAQVGGGVV